MLIVHHSMKDQAAVEVSDDAFAKRAERWPRDTPDTKEAYWIRDIFDGECCATTYRAILTKQRTGLFKSETAASTAVRYVSMPSRAAADTYLSCSTVGYLEETGAARRIRADGA